MADNFLERHRDAYEQRKKEWLLRKRHIKRKHNNGESDKRRPEDEAL